MKSLAAIVATVLITASLTQIATAAPPAPTNPTPTRLEGYCNENGGTYSPPNASGYYACIFPDGTVVACGGSISGCSTITASTGLPGGKVPVEFINVSLQMQTLSDLTTLSTQLDGIETKIDTILQNCPFVP